ncbi:YbaB/EbfC family nucleoid-associated protein [bacterium]|nr:YbaB/EbfC family nucleoid-associated protein [bacterium]
MNIMQMMKQAQNLQKKLKDTQDELAKIDVVGEAGSGAVKVTCDGQGKFKSIKLTAEALNPEAH